MTDLSRCCLTPVVAFFPVANSLINNDQVRNAVKDVLDKTGRNFAVVRGVDGVAWAAASGGRVFQFTAAFDPSNPVLDFNLRRVTLLERNLAIVSEALARANEERLSLAEDARRALSGLEEGLKHAVTKLSYPPLHASFSMRPTAALLSSSTSSSGSPSASSSSSLSSSSLTSSPSSQKPNAWDRKPVLVGSQAATAVPSPPVLVGSQSASTAVPALSSSASSSASSSSLSSSSLTSSSSSQKPNAWDRKPVLVGSQAASTAVPSPPPPQQSRSVARVDPEVQQALSLGNISSADAWRDYACESWIDSEQLIIRDLYAKFKNTTVRTSGNSRRPFYPLGHRDLHTSMSPCGVCYW
jgi:hypothetical protein